MSTQNICLCGEIRKKIYYLSVEKIFYLKLYELSASAENNSTKQMCTISYYFLLLLNTFQLVYQHELGMGWNLKSE